MEDDAFRLNLSVLDVDFVSAQDDRDVFAHAHQISVPVGHVFVRDSAGYVEQDDGAVRLDVVAVAQATQLLLSGRVPHVEPFNSS